MARFTIPQDTVFQQLNASIGFDWRLGPYDIEQSRAHVKMLAAAGIVTAADRDALLNGLDRVAEELDSGSFPFREDDEDIHMAIERRLTEIAGPVGGKLHTARSRNDQVATDMRLFARAACEGRLHEQQESPTVPCQPFDQATSDKAREASNEYSLFKSHKPNSSCRNRFGVLLSEYNSWSHWPHNRPIYECLLRQPGLGPILIT